MRDYMQTTRRYSSKKAIAYLCSLSPPLTMADEDSAPLSQQERDATILKYEAFINDRLKVDMDLILQERDKIYEELSS